jgi:hypothetical protein
MVFSSNNVVGLRGIECAARPIPSVNRRTQRLNPSKVSHHWATLANPAKGDTSNGLLLWFVVDDFDAAWQRAQTVDRPIVDVPNTDNGTGMRAFVIVDPDGYHVAINERRTS